MLTCCVQRVTHSALHHCCLHTPHSPCLPGENIGYLSEQQNVGLSLTPEIQTWVRALLTSHSQKRRRKGFMMWTLLKPCHKKERLLDVHAAEAMSPLNAATPAPRM